MHKRMSMLIAGVMLLAGCGVSGEAAAPAAMRWDPCSIPPDALEATGLDPSYSSVVPVSPFSLCNRFWTNFRSFSKEDSSFLGKSETD